MLTQNLPDFWENLYSEGKDYWNLKGVTPALKEFFKHKSCPETGSVLVPLMVNLPSSFTEIPRSASTNIFTPAPIFTFLTNHTADYSPMMAGLVLGIIPVLIFYFIGQKYIIEGVVAGSVKG